jgi:Glycosyl transferases group 1
MAYHLGRILHYDFGLEAISVRVGDENIDNGVHDYDLRMPVITVDDLSRTITDNDILIVNPSFSKHLFGWKFSGFKISYVQGFTTYTVLDRRLDHYVAVSDHVQNFLRAMYGIEAPVIPAFINLDGIPNAPNWEHRPQFDVLPYEKGIAEIWDISYRRLKELVETRGCEVRFKETIFRHRFIRQSQLFAKIGTYRYLLMLSAAEGFPLVPLEAMAMGTVVIGYDGFGGRHYMRPRVNCAVAPYADIEQVADLLTSLLKSPKDGLAISNRARETAKQYSYSTFRKRWFAEFCRILGVSTGESN